MEYFAHSMKLLKEDPKQVSWQRLAEHLHGVAKKAATFAVEAVGVAKSAK